MASVHALGTDPPTVLVAMTGLARSPTIQLVAIAQVGRLPTTVFRVAKTSNPIVEI